jgi:hypothetical protein
MANPVANTVETYDVTLLREDLAEAYSMISPTEKPFQAAVGTTTCSSTHFEWPVAELAAVDADNRTIEGESDVGLDTGTNGERRGNYTQISDKAVGVSQTAEAVTAAGNNMQTLNAQVVLKMLELARDKEAMLLSNVAGSAGAKNVARVSAGLPAFIMTNTAFEAGGADPQLSGTTTGYPSVAAVAGTTPVLFAESTLNDLLEAIWLAGGKPSLLMVNSGNKRQVSQNFTGNATRYKDGADRTVLNAVDIYDSDFGVVTVVPNRFQPVNNPAAAAASQSYNVIALDPDYASVAYLDPVKKAKLAKTGHADSELIWCEYGLQVDNEQAMGIIRDTNNKQAA